ncbi:MAG: hypothetical protein IIU28_02790 [Lachnospiraceae bacterium]|nr:hypothetical protein [Lachnospiraceae bacterium]
MFVSGSRKDKVFAGLVSCLFLLMVITSLFYISTNLHHRCSGENCPVCEEIHLTWQTMTTIQIVPVFAVAGILLLFAKIFSIVRSSQEETSRTLVSLKVELLA